MRRGRNRPSSVQRLASDLLALRLLGVFLQEGKQAAYDLLEPRELQPVAEEEGGQQHVPARW